MVIHGTRKKMSALSALCLYKQNYGMGKCKDKLKG